MSVTEHASLFVSGARRVISPWWFAWAAVVVIGLAIRCLERPVYGFNDVYDDELLVRMAQGFIHGNWSTSWSVSGTGTLAKPVGYSLFLAAAHFIPWSPLISTYLLYLFGTILISWGWGSISRSRWQATVILVALTLAPVLFADGNQRIYRDSLSDAVGTVAIGLAFVLAARLGRKRGGNRLNLGLVLGIGISVGFLSIIKPGWYWVIPAVAAPLLYPVWRKVAETSSPLRSVGWGVVAVLVVVVGLAGVSEALVLTNKHVYGVALTDDFSEGQFSRAWKRWVSVEAGPRPVLLDPINPEMRSAVYRVSPAARLIEPYFETPKSPWTMGNCLFLKKAAPRTPCDGAGLWTEWDLRTSATNAKETTSAIQFEGYFKVVADQISRACASGGLRCDPTPVLGTGVLPLDDISLSSTASETLDGISSMVYSHYVYGSPESQVPFSSQIYREWASVVPGVPPLKDLSNSTPSGLYSPLRIWGQVYGVLNVAALAALAFALVRWSLLRAAGRRPALDNSPAAVMTMAGLFGLAAVLGVASLATVGGSDFVVFAYWLDFSTPLQLSVVFAGFAAAALLSRRPGQVGLELWPDKAQQRVAPALVRPDPWGAGTPTVHE